MRNHTCPSLCVSVDAPSGICKIWRYKRKIARLRKKAGLPELYDPDDLPDPVYDPNYVQVLTDKEQIDLHYRSSQYLSTMRLAVLMPSSTEQHQFMSSQTWYRPHGTQTHRVSHPALGKKEKRER